MSELCDIKTRTFGLEIEMCNFDKKKVELPEGYVFSKTEQIVNTDGKTSSRYGGEVNTPPLLLLCQKDRANVYKVYSEMLKAGGKIKWSIDTHVHIYAGDLEVEQLKSIVYLLYHCYSYIKEYCHISDWDEKVYVAQPKITEDHYYRVKKAQTIRDLSNVFINQSSKGFYRVAFNVASFFAHKTVEFRCFHASSDMHLIENCIIASYRFFYFAINHTEEEMKSIKSYDEFVKKLKLPKETPPLIEPLIYIGNPYNPEGCFCTDFHGFNAKMVKALVDTGVKDLCLSGGSSFDYELALWKTMNVTIYNQSEYRHILWLIANGKLKLKYQDEFGWVQQYNNNTVARQIAVALYVTSNVRKVVSQKNQYMKELLDAYKAKAEETILIFEEQSKELIEMLTKVHYVYGNLHDAITNNKNVFYQLIESKKSRSAYNAIKNYSDLDMVFDRRPDDYYDFVEMIPKDTTFFMFSDSPYISSLKKIAVIKSSGSIDGIYLYSNKDIEKVQATTEYKESSEIRINVPPDNIAIDDPTKLHIEKVYSSEFFQLQKIYVKKVDKLTRPAWCFVVMYDENCLGGVGFDFTRNKEADLWQLSDFCTNNAIPRISKLILLCALSKYVQRELSRTLGKKISSVITYVYTDNPVSMKYRGIYEKSKQLTKKNRLAYMGDLGKYSTKKEIITKYQSLISRTK